MTPFDATRIKRQNLYVSNPQQIVADDVDWRTKGVVTNVKNEGQCGSCWAFSTVTSIECAWGLSVKKNAVSLSAQELIDCSESYGNYGCNGGLIDPSYQYIIDNKGIDTEESYPYKAQTGPSCLAKNGTIGARISSYKDIQSGSEKDLTSAVMNIGVISGAIDASQTSFQFYTKGVYYDSQCSSTNLDHGVNIVGYGSTNGQDYYIVKNMWGTSWGDNGYVLMSRNRNNNCGIATMNSYPIV